MTARRVPGTDAVGASRGRRESIGARIRRYRVDAGLSQGQLARRIERPQAVLSRWETGRLEPRIPDLAGIAEVLAIDVASLVEGRIVAPGRRRSGRRSPIDARRRVGDALRTAREASGLDRLTVARRAACSVRRLHRLEAGMEPGLEELSRLAAILGTPMQRLVAASLDTAEDPPRVPEDTERVM